MERRNLFRPEQIIPIYEEITVVYQRAFAGDPWYEVSKCVDESQKKRCPGGLSSLSPGDNCITCDKRPSTIAYEVEELVKRFDYIAATRPTQWYLEKGDMGVTLAAIAWKEDVDVIFKEKYSDVPEMEAWLRDNLGEREVCWLDEAFADRLKKPEGNLKNFGGMCEGLAFNLNSDTIAFRTINPRMIRAAKRDFGDLTSVFERNTLVPDRRDFVIIKLGGQT